MPLTLPARGRLITVKRGAVPSLIASVRTKSLAINGEAIDVSTDDDSGWRKLLDQPGEVGVEISVSGVLKDETLIQEAISTTDRVAPTEFGWPGTTPGKLAGDFFLQSFNVTGEYKGAATFEATFVSTGTVAFTAAL